MAVVCGCGAVEEREKIRFHSLKGVDIALSDQFYLDRDPLKSPSREPL
jgi:hypothetical protein